MFLVCGEALVDVFAGPADGDRLTFEGVAGGSPFNVAVGLARLGVPTGFLAGLSEDALGRMLAARLEREGVSLRWTVRRPERTTLSLVGLRPDGVPDYAFYGPGADAALSVADLPALGSDVRGLPEVRGLHLGSYAIAVPPVADALAVLAARAANRLVVLDPNIRLGVVPDPRIWRSRIEALLPHLDVVKASEEDLALLWPGRDPAEIAGDWLTKRPRLVVVTRGAQGASGHRRGAEPVRVAAPSVAVVDTVGAGDAFQAALIAGLLAAGIRGREDVAAMPVEALDRLLSRCARAGAVACTRRGADPPRRDELFTEADSRDVTD